MIANDPIGTLTINTAWTADYLTTLRYDLQYAVSYSSFEAIYLLSNFMTLQHIRLGLYWTILLLGQVVVGTSALHGKKIQSVGMPEYETDSAE